MAREYQVDVQQEVALEEEVVARVKTAVLSTLWQQEAAPPLLLSCLLTDNDQVQQLNREFLGEDRPTDVLSFPAGEEMPGMEAYLGDIAIAVPYAAAQAASAGHSLVEELQLLAIHGVLHLLGHDHNSPEAKARMWAAQAAVLARLGLEHVRPTEE